MAIQSFQNLGKEMSQQLHLANIFLSCSFFPGKQSIDFFFFLQFEWLHYSSLSPFFFSVLLFHLFRIMEKKNKTKI